MFTCLLDIEHAWSRGFKPQSRGLNIIKTPVPRHAACMPDDEYSTILKAFADDEAPEFELSAALEP